MKNTILAFLCVLAVTGWADEDSRIDDAYEGLKGGMRNNQVCYDVAREIDQ